MCKFVHLKSSLAHFMKNFPIVLLVFLFFISCNSSSPVKPETNPDHVVGTAQNGAYTVADEQYFKERWEEALHKNGPTSQLGSFAIVKGKTMGDAVLDCYLLTAATTDGKAKVATLLIKKDNTFYLDNKNHISIICTSDCTTGCTPLAMVKKNRTFLICADCNDCVKTEIDVDFY